MRLGWRWLLVIARVAGWIAVFLAIVVPHLLFTLFGRRDIVPPPFLGTLARVAGVRVTVVGRPAPHALLLPNHLSWIDILALAGASRTAFVAHAGLSQNRPLEWLCLQNETLFITRDERRTVGTQVEAVADRLGHRRLTIFPEATTGDGTGLLPFRSSLLSAVERLPGDVTVQPVALDYADPRDIAWVGDEPGLVNFCKILARTTPVRLTIRFLEPLTGKEMRDRKAMAAAAREKIEAALAR